MKITKFVKDLVSQILNRKYIFENKAIHPSDAVNTIRCLDITFVDYLNEITNLKINRTNGYKVFWMGF